MDIGQVPGTSAIVERLGEAAPDAGYTERMAAVRDVLPAHATFVDVTGRWRWQVGRLGGQQLLLSTGALVRRTTGRESQLPTSRED